MYRFDSRALQRNHQHREVGIGRSMGRHGAADRENGQRARRRRPIIFGTDAAFWVREDESSPAKIEFIVIQLQSLERQRETSEGESSMSERTTVRAQARHMGSRRFQAGG